MAIYRRAYHHIGSELDVMYDYVLTTSHALRQAHDNLHIDVSNKVAGLSQGEAQEVFNDYADDDIFLGRYFPALSSSWTFVSIYSFLEHQLVYICRVIEKAKDGTTEFRPRGRVLDVCKTKLRQLDIEVRTGGHEWQELKNLQGLRNAIVHRLGELEESTAGGRDERIYRYVQRRNDVSVEHRSIVPTHDFCVHVIETVRAFLTQVVDLIPNELYATGGRER